jgi:hypothetical protein
MSAAKIIVAALRADATIGPLIGNARIYPEDGIPRGAATPYLAYSVQSNTTDRDLNGRISGYESNILLEVVADTVSQVQAIIVALPTSINAIVGTTVATYLVDDALAVETGDEINGPIDEDDNQEFSGTATISLYYGGS